MKVPEPEIVNELRTTLLPVFPGYGFQVRLLSYVPEAFGNCVVELASPQAGLPAAHGRLLSPELLVRRSAELIAHRQEISLTAIDERLARLESEVDRPGR